MLWKIFPKVKLNHSATVEKNLLSEFKKIIDEFNQKIDLRFQETNSHLKEIELSLAELERKLLTKDLKDKQALGLLHYRIEEKIKNKN